MKKKLSYIYFVFFLVNTTQGQMSLDTINLPEVVLTETRVAIHDIATQTNLIKTSSLSEGSAISLDRAISYSSPVYIKKYGALATPAFRGTTSAHTLILWNGIPINSIANGLSDLSSIYCYNFSDIVVVHGGDASLFGSGAIGGSLHLDTKPELVDSNNISLNLTKGSYGLSSHSLDFAINNGKLIAKGSLHYLENKNEFTYINTTQIGHPVSVNEYGRIKSNSQNLNLFYRFSRNTSYEFNYWASDLEREVPQNMTVIHSDAKQYDKAKRFLLALNYTRGGVVILGKQAYIREDFKYTEISKSINSKYLAESYISDLDFKVLKSNFLLNLAGAFTCNKIVNNNYASMPDSEKIFAAFSSLQYRSEYLALNTVIRKEWHTTYNVPLVPTVAFESTSNSVVKFRVKFNRSFRSPTFNDRFWVSSGARGNMYLKPEDAWNKELGFDFKTKCLELNITAYHLNISDMIVWQQMGNNIWTPNNVDKVLSRGIELKVRYNLEKLSIVGDYAFTKSINKTTNSTLDISAEQQLRYVPVHKGNISSTIKLKKIELSLTESYIGEVITTYGYPQNKTLDGFFLTDFSIKYRFIQSPLVIQFKVKNLTNKSYITYQNYPNPMREYLLTLNYII